MPATTDFATGSLINTCISTTTTVVYVYQPVPFLPRCHLLAAVSACTQTLYLVFIPNFSRGMGLGALAGAGAAGGAGAGLTTSERTLYLTAILDPTHPTSGAGERAWER